MTGDHIALELNIPQRTVSRHFIEAHLSRQKDPEPRDEDPPQRYEHEAPSDMIHLDINALRNFNEGSRKSTQFSEQGRRNEMYTRSCR